MTLAQFLDFAAVFVFALTGGLVASRAQLDIVGFLFVAALTGIGGGTVRDVILGRDAVFWVANPVYLVIVCIAAGMVYLGAHLLESRYRPLLWLDAVALAIAVSAGALTARNLGASWPIELVMGVMTGCLGGLMRDVVCNEVPLVLKQGEVYVTAAFAGALTGVLALGLTGSALLSVFICAVVTFLLRAGSLAFGWRLPVYRSTPRRTRLK
ncbi:trimeric intracellular cation channel family protein [Rhodobacteraceae bacterium DSL-40]|uniref:trimeric intracellular cation channel family protein n=1 Tax=Amaricoccus sp. B4 TaxID=3368557 RepID=UPI000DAC6A17